MTFAAAPAVPLLASDGPDGPSWSPYAAVGGFVVACVVLAILYARRDRNPGEPVDGTRLRRWKTAARATFGLCALSNLAQAVWHPDTIAWNIARAVLSALFLVAVVGMLVTFFAERRRAAQEDGTGPVSSHDIDDTT